MKTNHKFAFEKLFRFKNKKRVILFIYIFLIFSMNSFSQITEYFDSGIPSSWVIKSNLATPPINNNWISSAAGTGYGGGTSKAAYVDPASNTTTGTTAQYFMISPQLVTPTNGEIRFYTKQGSFSNYGTTYQLKVSTASQPDISSFNVTLGTWTESQLNVSATTYEEKIIPITTLQAGIPFYLAFVAVTSQTGTSATKGDKWYVDNFRLIGSCSPVTAINTSIGADNATISWTHPTATSFGIEVVPSGAGHGATGNPVTGTSYTATGLTLLTTYDVYIKTNCDSTTSSTWAGPFSFTTAAIGLTCSTAIQVPSDVTVNPYVYTNNLSQFYDGSTYVDYNSQTLSCQPANTPSTWNLLSGNHAYFSFTPSTTGLVNISQAVNVASGGGNNCYNAYSSLFVFNGCTGVGTSAACLAGIMTGSNMLTAQLNNFYVQAGQTYIILISSPYALTNPGAGICFTLTISGSTQTCAIAASQTANTPVSCFGGTNGTSTITMTPTPSTTAITYMVDGGASQNGTLSSGAFTVSGLSSGTHTVVISSSGCSNVTATGVSIYSPTALSATATAGTITCNGGTTLVTVSATGGTPPYTGTGSFTHAAGNYSYMVTDNLGCTYLTYGNITVNPKTTPTFTQVAAVCSGATIAALPTTSNNGITGSWSPVLNNNETTTYTFTPNAGQCAAATSQTITITTPKVTSPISFVAPTITVATLPNVTIGTQVWTSKNLDVSIYRDGTPIPQVTDPTQWGSLTTGAWCYYNNDPANGEVYGKLYNWYAVAGIYNAASLNDKTLRKQFAPLGWHVPSDPEWTTLTNYLGGVDYAAGKMKETGTTHWFSPNTGATNSSGFTGLPGGFRNYYDGIFDSIGNYGFWWSSSELDTVGAWSCLLLYNNYSNGNRSPYNKFNGFSVRCLRD